jgi:hypothetical protein
MGQAAISVFTTYLVSMDAEKIARGHRLAEETASLSLTPPMDSIEMMRCRA